MFTLFYQEVMPRAQHEWGSPRFYCWNESNYEEKENSRYDEQDDDRDFSIDRFADDGCPNV